MIAKTVFWPIGAKNIVLVLLFAAFTSEVAASLSSASVRDGVPAMRTSRLDDHGSQLRAWAIARALASRIPISLAA